MLLCVRVCVCVCVCIFIFFPSKSILLMILWCTGIKHSIHQTIFIPYCIAYNVVFVILSHRCHWFSLIMHVIQTLGHLQFGSWSILSLFPTHSCYTMNVFASSLFYFLFHIIFRFCFNDLSRSFFFVFFMSISVAFTFLKTGRLLQSCAIKRR